MLGEHEASICPFDQEYPNVHAELKTCLQIQVRRFYWKWNRRLDANQLEEEVARLFFEIVKTKSKYDPARATLLTWANKVAIWRLKDRQRELMRAYSHPRVLTGGQGCHNQILDLLLSKVSNEPEDQHSAELIEIVLQELAQLPTSEQCAIRQRILQGMQYPEIAALLETTQAGARGIVCRGLKRLGDRVRSRLYDE